MKRLSSPKSWKIKRKGITFITRPLPGAHSFKEGVSLSTLLKHTLHLANTTDEVKKILQNNTIKVDGKRVKEKKYLVGVMDTVEVAETKQCYRILLNRNGEIIALPIDAAEAKIKPCRIISKTLLKQGRMQLNLSDGRNILLEKGSYKVGDSLLLEVPEQKIKDHFKFEKGAYLYFISGKYAGMGSILKDIKGGNIICSIKDALVETRKQFAFVIGKEKPSITMENKLEAK